MITSINDAMRQQATHVLAEFNQLTAEEKSILKKIDRLYDLVEDGEVDDLDKSRLKQNKQRYAEIQNRLKELHLKIKSNYLNEEQEVTEVIESYNALENNKAPESLQVLINTFLDRVIIWKDEVKVILKVYVGLVGAEDRNRTGTEISLRRILSPLRLPVPPPRHIHHMPNC